MAILKRTIGSSFHNHVFSAFCQLGFYAVFQETVWEKNQYY